MDQLCQTAALTWAILPARATIEHRGTVNSPLSPYIVGQLRVGGGNAEAMGMLVCAHIACGGYCMHGSLLLRRPLSLSLGLALFVLLANGIAARA